MVDLDTDTTWIWGLRIGRGLGSLGNDFEKRVGGRGDGGSGLVVEGGYNNGGRLTA